MNKFPAALALAMCLMVVPSAAGQFIYIKLSIKVVLNPADGTRPSGVNDTDIDRMIEGMNNLMAGYLRGYRFRRVDPIWNVGGRGDTTGPSRYYSVNFLDDDEELDKDDMEDDAEASPGLYRWNSSAINIYVNGATGGGQCSFPSDELVAVGGRNIHNVSLVFHELGHYFDLYHTQGSTCGDCDDCDSPESDEIADTLPDWPCWDENGIANNAFGLSYAALTEDQRKLVDDVFHNIMSYHNGGSAGATSTSLDRLTELQLDRWTDTVLSERRHVMTGVTRFVDSGLFSLCPLPDGSSHCLTVVFLGGPFAMLSAAVSASNPDGGDIVMLKPGRYTEWLTIDQAVTLRATQNGAVTIGR